MSTPTDDEIRALVDKIPAPPWELWADDDEVIGKTICNTYPSSWPIVRTPLHEPSSAGMNATDEFAIGQFIAAAPSLVASLLARATQAEQERETCRNAQISTECWLHEVEQERDALRVVWDVACKVVPERDAALAEVVALTQEREKCQAVNNEVDRLRDLLDAEREQSRGLRTALERIAELEGLG